MFRRMFILPVVLVVFVLHGMDRPAGAQEMRVTEIPVYEGAADVSYMKRRGDVRYQISSDFKTVGTYYTKQLTADNWRKSKRDNLQRNFWVQTFSKGDMTLEVRVDSRDSGSEVRLTPKGLMWEEDDQPTPRDLPYPADASKFEYNDFLGWIDYTSESDVKSVVDFLTTELEKRKWTKTSTEQNSESFVRMNFAFDKSTLQIDVRAEDSGSDISIRTKGMQWDGMKDEIERAEKEAERLAAAEEAREAEEEAKQEAAAMAAALEERRNRPKKGIENLPELPNVATVVMDGKTFKLTSVIAYEVFDFGEWTTKVIATQKPVKLDNLLARLKATGKDTDDEGSSPNWSEPYLQVIIDDEDRPWRIGFVAGGTPGNGSGDELEGDALVEDGRARGTVKLREPGSFFDRVYTAEISFDVPVLTRDSVAPKRLQNAPKLANSGTLRLGNRTYNLKNVVAYKMMLFDDPMTTILLTQDPINQRNLRAALGRPAADEFFEFTPQVKLLVDSEDNVSSVSIWADNASLSGNNALDHDVVIEDGRARGVAKMTEPGEFFGKQYSFEVSFDVDVLGSASSAPRPSSSGLAVDSYEGVPIPAGYDGIESEGSPFRTESRTTVAAQLEKVAEFYQSEMASGQWGSWKETAADVDADRQTAELAFTGPDGGLMVQLRANGAETQITLITQDAAAARNAGMLPAAGKSRLFIANDSPRESAITISGREYTIAAGAGARNPKTGFNWEVAPGNYTIEVETRSGQLQSETVKLPPNQTIGVIIDATGAFQVITLY